MTNTKGITEVKVYDKKAVEDRYGITPEKIPDFIGLKGDASDNIPGIPGIGDKTAADLLSSYESVEDILSHTSELKGKRRQLLEEYAAQARMSRDLAVLNDEVPVEISQAMAAGSQPPDPAKLSGILNRYEFSTLLRRMRELGMLAAAPGDTVGLQLQMQQTDAEGVAAVMSRAAEFAIAWEESAGKLKLSVYIDGGPVYILTIGPQAMTAILNSLVKGGGKRPLLLCHDYKSLLAIAPAIIDCSHDTLVGAYLLKPVAKTYKIEQLAAAAGIDVGIADGRPGERALAARAAEVFALARQQQEKLDAQGQLKLFTAVEMPLLRVLAEMERTGIQVDLARLGELALKVSDQMEQLRDHIRELTGAGEEFNVDSPQQLAAVLFDKLGLPAGKKTKTGFSTNASVLRGLRAAHPVISEIEIYRELAKLYGTYLRALPELADRDTWRIHTTFNQTVTATGRISSSNPNLQNIPIRTALGEKIRDCFVAREGHKLVAADYSQVELRIMAHLSGEPKLRQAFAAGDDVHRDTAAEVFHLDPGEVSAKQRSRAKAVNFGIMYGISAFGLAEQLDISREEAAAYISTYLERYPMVAKFRNEVIEQALKNGYVSTIMGRRRPIPELRAGDDNTRRLGERLAINTVIQGSAADIIKAAMVGCYRQLAGAGMQSRLVMQAHDELVFEAPETEVEAVADMARQQMCGAWPLDPPLVVDLGMGDTWLEAK